MSTQSTGRVREAAASAAPAAPAPATPAAPVIPTENPAAYDEDRVWHEPPWGDTYWCEMCSTCMRWRYSQRAGGRVCVTSYNFNFPLVIIEQGQCNEYRPVPGAEGLWNDEYAEEEDEYTAGGVRPREEAGVLDEEMERRHSAARRRPRRRARRPVGGPPTGA